ncbi:chondroitin sulfate synthase 1-like [Gigantopelta aegis]|uniref:chondroitin sulfate synthase 1-like n=1 Tax=Gigantopelta aegis TaxID=1735272 RepID=UPI001B88BA5F|nr:chondroitin sulfate synthase 1-like [Gigantopelta aegis]
MRRRRRIETMFRDLILSVLVGFVTGFITTQTLMLFLWKHHALACKLAYSRHHHQPHDMIGRLRGLHSETTNKKLLFVGVMTTRKNLETKAKAIFDTWGQHVPGRLVFFVGTGDRVASPLPVIELSDVADVGYPSRC